METPQLGRRINQPYLPPEQPLDNPAATHPPVKKGVRRTLLIWFVLICCFLAIYWVMAPDPLHPRPPPPASTTTGWEWFARLAPLALLGLVVWWLRRQYRGGAEFQSRIEPGNLAMAEGDLLRAGEIFAQVVSRYPHGSPYAISARFALVGTLRQRGKLERATELAIEIERSPGVMFGASVRVAAALELALLYTLRGQLDAGQRWIDDVRRRMARSRDERLSHAAYLCFTEAAHACRSGRPAEAAELLDRNERRMQGSLTVLGMQPAWLIRAFAASAFGPRESAERWLVALRGCRRGSLDWMAVEWPELGAFLAAHELSSPRSAA